MVLSVMVIFLIGCGNEKDKHSDNDGHDHSAHAHESDTAADKYNEGDVHDDNGHNEAVKSSTKDNDNKQETAEEHASHAGQEHVDHAKEIKLSDTAVTMAGIIISEAVEGSIKEKIVLNGEISFNEEKMIHVTPRFSGIAKEAKYNLGDFVNTGDIVAVIESNESMSQYTCKSSISGWVIEKHIVPGEHVTSDESIYVIADMNTVWVNLSVYIKDAHKVHVGQKATIAMSGSNLVTEGVIKYITPMIDSETRRVTTRIILPNPKRVWRPGAFVNATVQNSDGAVGVIVKKESVQIVNEKTVVFVQEEKNTYRQVAVVTGLSDSENVIILEGVTKGTRYVSQGAFELKAQIVTSSLGEHAGHNH
jgi:cobalt-zinc-cadmium efflux system membrane fusion protein